MFSRKTRKQESWATIISIRAWCKSDLPRRARGNDQQSRHVPQRMMYTHVLKQSPHGISSPADGL